MSTTTKKVAIFVDWENVRKEIEYMPWGSLSVNLDDKSMQAICKKENLNCFDVQDIMSIIRKSVDKNSEDIFQIFVYDVNPLSLEEEQERLKNEKERIEAELISLRENSNLIGCVSLKQHECSERFFKIPNLDYFDKYKNMCNKEYMLEKEKATKIIESHQELKKEDFLKLRLDTQKVLCFNKDDRPVLKSNQANMLFLALDIARVAYRHLVDEIIVFSKNEDIIPALECAQMNDLHVSLVHIKEWDSIEDLKEKWQISEELRKHADSVREISLLEIIKDKKPKEGQ